MSLLHFDNFVISVLSVLRGETGKCPTWYLLSYAIAIRKSLSTTGVLAFHEAKHSTVVINREHWYVKYLYYPSQL